MPQLKTFKVLSTSPLPPFNAISEGCLWGKERQCTLNNLKYTYVAHQFRPQLLIFLHFMKRKTRLLATSRLKFAAGIQTEIENKTEIKKHWNRCITLQCCSEYLKEWSKNLIQALFENTDLLRLFRSWWAPVGIPFSHKVNTSESPKKKNNFFVS